MGFAVPRTTGGYVAGVGRSVVAVDWPTQTMTSLVELDLDKANNRLNDGKADPIGRLLAGRSAYFVNLLTCLRCHGNSVTPLRFNGEGEKTCRGGETARILVFCDL